MEVSALNHLGPAGLRGPTPLLRLQGDERLVALTRKGNQGAYEALVARYQARLLAFCRHMLGSREDAEDVLQEVFAAAFNAMIADERPLNVRPWLYRIARNRCLNHLRKPTADGQDTMDTHPHMNGVTTLERVQNREEFRNLLEDVSHLPETQRSALLLREIDAMSYEEIAQAMDTTVPGVKSLLVRARIALAESSQARQLTCDEVRLQLAEAAEGLAKLDGAGRRQRHRPGDRCQDHRSADDARARVAGHRRALKMAERRRHAWEDLIDDEEYAKAIPLLQQSIQEKGEYADALNLLGYANRKLGDKAKAMTYYTKALNLEPNHLGANEYLGELYLELNDLPKAEERLAVLKNACGDCDEYDDLEDEIEDYKEEHGLS